MPVMMPRAAWCVALLLAVGLLMPQAAAAAPELPAAPEARRSLRLPLITYRENGCPPTGAAYGTIPIASPPSDRAAARHADLNLGLRGWQAVVAPLKAVEYGGATDAHPPQLRGLFADRRTPGFTSTHQVYDWDWACGADGCRGRPITFPQVTLLGLATRGGEPLFAPSRAPEIYPGGYIALVLYAEEHRLTLKYTREDNVVGGYTVQLENLCVDPNLLRVYREVDAGGRAHLPALRNGQMLGTATGSQVQAAVRDCGSYLDPRSRKDWWQ